MSVKYDYDVDYVLDTMVDRCKHFEDLYVKEKDAHSFANSLWSEARQNLEEATKHSSDLAIELDDCMDERDALRKEVSELTLKVNELANKLADMTEVRDNAVAERDALKEEICKQASLTGRFQDAVAMLDACCPHQWDDNWEANEIIAQIQSDLERMEDDGR